MSGVPCPGPGWEENLDGRQPEHTRGKRIAVVLASGEHHKSKGVAVAKPGWEANSTNWARRSGPLAPFNVAWFKVL